MRWPQTPKGRTGIILVLLLGLTLGAYWQACRCDFINLDDGVYVYRNPFVRKGFSVEGVRWALGAELLGVAHVSGDAWLRTDGSHDHVVAPFTYCRSGWAFVSGACARLLLQ